MRDVFPQWSDTILQHFLYANNMPQDNNEHKYLLAVNIDKIIKDESAVKDERERFDDEIDELANDAEEDMKKKEKELDIV